MAVMVAVPTPIAFTTPLFTVATELFEVVHVTVLSVALLGVTVAVKVKLLPAVRVFVDWLRVIPVTLTLTLPCSTVTTQVAV